MNKGIVLYGIENVGKSITLRKVYELLKSKYIRATEQFVIVGRFRRAGLVVDDYLAEAKDFRVIFVIDGTKIGIESMGDPPRQKAS